MFQLGASSFSSGICWTYQYRKDYLRALASFGVNNFGFGMFNIDLGLKVLGNLSFAVDFGLGFLSLTYP